MEIRVVLVAALVAALAGVASANWDITPEDLTTCKSVLKMIPELKNTADGHTVFCPTNEAFTEFAEMLGFEGTNPVAQLMSSASQGPAMLKAIVGFHVTKGVMPAANLHDGASIKTLADGAALRIVRDGDDIEIASTLIDVESADSDDPEHTDFVSHADLTFDGFYDKKSKHVIHAIERVLVPQAAAAAMRQLYIANTE
ncbi:MAG: hypothetical protein J3K34DRAFT_527077 [Monoraphidium minutum]|nr:MAG: hypothetical protein J3K34DRAFT_527077 [Monoraphidium minutum]